MSPGHFPEPGLPDRGGAGSGLLEEVIESRQHLDCIVFIAALFEGRFDRLEVFFVGDLEVLFADEGQDRAIHFSQDGSGIVGQKKAEPGGKDLSELALKKGFFIGGDGFFLLLGHGCIVFIEHVGEDLFDGLIIFF